MARRKISLREYQQGVVAKLQAIAQGGEIQAASKLGLQVGDQYWLVDLADVGEVIPPPELARVPHSQPWFSGVANIRGNLYSVVDFSAFCGGEAVSGGAEKRLILANARFLVNSGLLVNRLLGLRHADQLQPREISSDAAPWISAEFSDADGRHWKELNIQALVSDQGFLQAGR
jgi:twitching motility protein PilI